MFQAQLAYNDISRKLRKSHFWHFLSSFTTYEETGWIQNWQKQKFHYFALFRLNCEFLSLFNISGHQIYQSKAMSQGFCPEYDHQMLKNRLCRPFWSSQSRYFGSFWTKEDLCPLFSPFQICVFKLLLTDVSGGVSRCFGHVLRCFQRVYRCFRAVLGYFELFWSYSEAVLRPGFEEIGKMSKKEKKSRALWRA